MESHKASLRLRILQELQGHPPVLADWNWGKVAERLRRIPPYRKSRRILVSLDPSLKQVRLNALTDQKHLVLPSRSLKSGFLSLDPKDIPPRKRLLAIQPHTGNPFASKIPYGSPLDPPIDLIVADSLAVGRDGSRLGDGQGHLDLQVAILGTLSWLHPEAVVVVVADEGRLQATLPMDDHDVRAHWIVTPHESFAMTGSGALQGRLMWDRLTAKQIKRNDALFSLCKIGIHGTPPGADTTVNNPFQKKT